MATTITLVEAGNNRLRYLAVYSGAGPQTFPDITTTGAASPDLVTDSLAGPVKQCAGAFTNGLGILAAGAKTQAQARAIWLADNSDTVLGNGKVPRCICRVTNRTGQVAMEIDANVDGSGHPVLQVGNSQSTVLAYSAYIDIQLQGGIGI